MDPAVPANAERSAATEDDQLDLTDADSAADPKVAIAWLQRHRFALSGLPAPGHGATLDRWRTFTAIARADLSLARLAEGHADALAILSELGRPDLAGDRCWGVWAAEPGRLIAEPARNGWRLVGEKRWCSGSTRLDHALVTATAPDGPRLFVIDTGAIDAIDGSWDPVGMVASGSDTMAFDTTVSHDAEVGGPNAYVDRPGFWMGAIGVAACWFGGALGVADALDDRVAATDESHVVNVRGRVRSRLDGAAAALTAAAAWLDAGSREPGSIRRRALSVRLLVDELARAVLDDVTVASGSSALAFERRHARRVADLTLYLRQLDRHGAEHDLGDGPSMAWSW